VDKKVVYEGLAIEMNAVEVEMACKEWARRAISSKPNGAKFTGATFVRRDKFGGCLVTVLEKKPEEEE
jgi:hypothetical protein